MPMMIYGPTIEEAKESLMDFLCRQAAKELTDKYGSFTIKQLTKRVKELAKQI